jgi:LytR cell envelope-related transcriptional attenuator
LVLDTAKAAPLLARLRGIGNPTIAQNAPKAVDPATIHVAVENGSGTTGLGARANDALGGLGFSAVGGATNADRSDYAVTEVRYASGAVAKAQFLFSYLGGAGKVVALQGDAPAGADVVLVLGRDYDGLTRPAATPASTAASGTKPTSSGSSSTGASSATAAPEVGC